MPAIDTHTKNSFSGLRPDAYPADEQTGALAAPPVIHLAGQHTSALAPLSGAPQPLPPQRLQRPSQQTLLALSVRPAVHSPCEHASLLPPKPPGSAHNKTATAAAADERGRSSSNRRIAARTHEKTPRPTPTSTSEISRTRMPLLSLRSLYRVLLTPMHAESRNLRCRGRRPKPLALLWFGRLRGLLLRPAVVLSRRCPPRL